MCKQCDNSVYWVLLTGLSSSFSTTVQLQINDKVAS